MTREELENKIGQIYLGESENGDRWTIYDDDTTLKEIMKIVDIYLSTHPVKELATDAVGFAEWVEASGYIQLDRDKKWVACTERHLDNPTLITTEQLYELYNKEL